MQEIRCDVQSASTGSIPAPKYHPTQDRLAPATRGQACVGDVTADLEERVERDAAARVIIPNNSYYYD